MCVNSVVCAYSNCCSIDKLCHVKSFLHRLDATTDSFDLMSESPRCCICLDEFTSPTTLPCGHVFCLECIGEYWRISDVCQCPLCKADFPERLELKTNQTRQSLAKTVPLRVGEVPCDFCSEEQAAVRSCLTCLASYCTAHLQPHYQTEDLRRHQLISVMKNFDDSVCRMHERPLGLFCKSDQTCICTKCAEIDHRGHRVISINREAAKKKVRFYGRNIINKNIGLFTF